MARNNLPVVKDNWLSLADLADDNDNHQIEVGTADWYEWLQTVRSFAFESDQGKFTARQEQAAGGKAYWKAYRKQQGKLYQTYLGKSQDLTLERLSQAAASLSQRQTEGQSEPDIKQVNEISEPDEPEDIRPAPVVIPPETASVDALTLVKMRPPAAPKELITRPRLDKQLAQIVQTKLTLISAPPGFGKTTLLADWFSQSRLNKGWLSLDNEDNDPARFWYYFTQVLETVQPGLISKSLFRQFQPAFSQQMVNQLLNQLTAIKQDCLLVLDDYHLIGSEQIQQGIRLLLEHGPAQLHLVIITRSDPPLPLSRLRVRRQLNEIRAEELRFTAEETRLFLAEIMGLNLSRLEVTTLEERLEGWIAGLQLVGLGLRGQSDVAGFIAAFRGSHRYILDYLAEEVLARLDETKRHFLLQTSILERMTAGLVEAITGREDGQQQLEELERANLFIFPLDQERRWYRYHHLFADYLSSRLQREQAEHVPFLHRWAAEWYEEQGMLADAIFHYLKSRDFEKAAGLIEQLSSAMLLRGEWYSLIEWVKPLPEQVIVAYPRLSLDYFWALINNQELEQAQAQLERLLAHPLASADHHLEAKGNEPDWYDEFISARAWLAFNQGDVIQTLELTRQVLGKSGASKGFLRLNFISLIEQPYGDSEKSALPRIIPLLEELVNLSSQFNQPHLTLFALHILTACKRQQGQFREVYKLCQEILQIGAQPSSSDYYSQPVGLIYMVQGVAAYYLNWLKEAEAANAAGLAFARQYRNREQEFLFQIALARAKLMLGKTTEAKQILEEVEQTEREQKYQVGNPLVLASQATLAWLWLLQGRLADAQKWAGQQDLEFINNNPSITREWENVNLARVLIAEQRFQEAITLLEPVVAQAIQMDRRFLVARSSVPQALAYQGLGLQEAAFAKLEQALKLAAPEGLSRLFLDEGPAMLELLQTYLSAKGDKLPQELRLFLEEIFEFAPNLF
jgi:LuxR family maltose regulon positive regulatory protein